MIDALFIRFSLLCTSMQFYCPLPCFIRTPVPLTAFNRVLSIFSLYSDTMYIYYAIVLQRGMQEAVRWFAEAVASTRLLEKRALIR